MCIRDRSLTEGSLDEGHAVTSQTSSYYDEEGWENCSACGAYTDDDGGNSTETESEVELLNSSPEELEHYLGSFEGTSLEQLREEYFLAKARFRHSAGKRSRAARFPRRAPWAQRRKGGKRPKERLGEVLSRQRR